MKSFLQLGLVALTGACALGVTASMFGSGCTVLSNDALPDDAGLEAGEGGACLGCLADQCVATMAMCLTNESCLAVRTCAKPNAALGTCDQACITACACNAPTTSTPLPATLYRAYAACTDERLCGTTTGCGATDCAETCLTTPASSAPALCDPIDAGAPDADSGSEIDAGLGDLDASVEDNDAGDNDLDGGVVLADASATDAAVEASTPQTAVDKCAACASTKCVDESSACAAGSDCNAFLGCVHACTDNVCVDKCGRDHAAGKAAAVALATCTQTGCEEECGLKNR